MQGTICVSFNVNKICLDYTRRRIGPVHVHAPSIMDPLACVVTLFTSFNVNIGTTSIFKFAWYAQTNFPYPVNKLLNVLLHFPTKKEDVDIHVVTEIIYPIGVCLKRKM